ncbi:DUF6005 family protein [Bacillus spongiae]|uniref:DUF6005 family protein n=1 Tax=Bacillus spongiae TaxID=2683610 RepID=A0ABU8H9K6_9BACI
MIKVHCFVSCVCEVIKKTKGVDHRPYYFGVWDADFDVQENMQLTYHSEQINHDFFKTWYEMLYGIKIHKWYNPQKTKQENIIILQELLENKRPNEHVMVMLDLSRLPERENKFNQTPFPHYVMLETTDNDEEWLMYDHDFRWEGVLPKDRIIASINEPSVAGGYSFDSKSIIPPDYKTVEAYFKSCMKHDSNPLTEAVINIVNAFTTGKEKHNLSMITLSLRELPVIAIRKYAYEHAFAYFWEHLQLNNEEFEIWCDEIEKLVKGYTLVQYRAMKFALTRNYAISDDILSKLDELNRLEFKIKNELQKYFNEWLQSQNYKVEMNK